MILPLAIVMLASMPDIHFMLAPDQPIPHVYMEDPLIIELESSADATARVQVVVEQADNRVTTVELGEVLLRAHGSVWVPVSDVAPDRGRYNARVSVFVGGEQKEFSGVFCRIDRRPPSLRLPVDIAVSEVGPYDFDALAAISVGSVRLDVARPDLDSQVEAALRAGQDVTMAVECREGEAPPPAAVEAAAQAHGSHVTKWQISPAGQADRLEAVVKGLRSRGVLAPIAVEIGAPDELRVLLSRGAGRFMDLLAVECDSPVTRSLVACRSALEQAGYERIPIEVTGRGLAEAEIPRAYVVQRIIEDMAAGAIGTQLEASLVFQEGEFGEVYVVLAGLARALHGASYIGTLPLGESIQAHLLRIGEQWRLVVWSESGPKHVEIPMGAAQCLGCTDVRFNPLPVPQANGAGAIELDLDVSPTYVTGTGGDFILRAAREGMKREAESFVKGDVFRKALPGDFLRIMEGIVQGTEPKIDRREFFALARTFPYFEAEWHEGRLPRETAVPAIAGLARLFRHLCVIEQEVGEPFNQPIHDTLDQCGRLQTEYVSESGSGGEGKNRGNWLLKEISGLMIQAEALVEENRPIEGGALAVVARWRAEALEAARKASPPELALPEIPALPPEQPGEPPAEEGGEAGEAGDPPAEGLEEPATAQGAEEPPGDSSETVEATNEGPPPAPPPDSGGKQTFTVEEGDSPWSISQKHQVDMEDLRHWNDWGKNHVLHVGDTYVIKKQ